jgi:hypothetical protein
MALNIVSPSVQPLFVAGPTRNVGTVRNSWKPGALFLRNTNSTLRSVAAKKSERSMSAEHKAALAEGRTQGRAVRTYLEALEANRPKRGRKRTPDSIKRRMETIESELQSADKLHALHLRQERRDLQDELASMDETVDLAGVEKDFVSAAKAYGERKGISYATWREAGVSSAVLKQAGISRSS